VLTLTLLGPENMHTWDSSWNFVDVNPTRVTASTIKSVKFQVWYQVQAAIIIRIPNGTGIIVLHHFVARPFLGKVIKAFLYIQ